MKPPLCSSRRAQALAKKLKSGKNKRPFGGSTAGKPDTVRPWTWQRNCNRDSHFLRKILDHTATASGSRRSLKLFERVHLVFYRSTEWTEKSLTTIILAKISQELSRIHCVAVDRDLPCRAALQEFEAALRTQFQIDNILEFNGTPIRSDSRL